MLEFKNPVTSDLMDEPVFGQGVLRIPVAVKMRGIAVLFADQSEKCAIGFSRGKIGLSS